LSSNHPGESPDGLLRESSPSVPADVSPDAPPGSGTPAKPTSPGATASAQQRARHRHVAGEGRATDALTITIPRFWAPLIRSWTDDEQRPAKPWQRPGLGLAALVVVATGVAGATGRLPDTVLAQDRSGTSATSAEDLSGAPLSSTPALSAPAAEAAMAVPAPPGSVPGPVPGPEQALQPGASPSFPPAAPSASLPATPVPGQSGATKQLSTSGVPSRAKSSYTSAAARMAVQAPGCRLPWTLLAAIGRVESDHGRYKGSALISSSGRAQPSIFGVRLDGTAPGTAVVRDTDRGTLDADTRFDRAVGPLQFLPSTWRAFAADGDGDRAADPQDLDDAALTAGRYLCARATSDLSTVNGQWSAAYRYNQSVSYANLVVALSTTYATGRPATVVNPPTRAAAPTVTVTVTPTPSVAVTAKAPTTAQTTVSPLTTTPSFTTSPTTTTTPTADIPGTPPVKVVTVTVRYVTVTVTVPGGKNTTRSTSRRHD
jgi:hypothetical protein